jgi:hypothetical protein
VSTSFQGIEQRHENVERLLRAQEEQTLALGKEFSAFNQSCQEWQENFLTKFSNSQQEIVKDIENLQDKTLSHENKLFHLI